jgi:hypothetical protein
LNDCREFHRRIELTKLHFKEPKVALQQTWRPLMLLMMTFLGRSADNDSLRNYQRDRWGAWEKDKGETCVIELSGLAAHSLKESKETGEFMPQRFATICGKVRAHRPKLVVLYGKSRRTPGMRLQDVLLDVIS